MTMREIEAIYTIHVNLYICAGALLEHLNTAHWHVA